MSDNKIGDVANTELESPGWLNAALVKEALRRGGEENYDVKQMTLKPAIAPGENYMSAIYRVNVTLQDGGERTLIIKTLPPGEMGKIAQECDVSRTEIAMFASILPEMETPVGLGQDSRNTLCLDKLKPHIIAKFAELNKPKPERFKVIVHGDFWINNMLFRYEDGAPQEVRLVDLQLSRVASPALDLLNFLSSSVSEDVSVHHEDLLLRGYHKALSEAMKLLKQEPPSLEDLLEDIDSHGTFALFGSLCGLPVIKAQKFVDLDAVVSGDNSGTVSLYEDPTVKRWLQRLLPEYKRKGWLPS